ncbi:F-box/FBD/LRR-repeat protein At1g13570-like [Apium graveolens]|uniref:F-box/FBD/LRR-repeat protein At1g13570-like n=1 Tax=Apium graveolens TaxID=4045 RepID=UPI003D78BA5A
MTVDKTKPFEQSPGYNFDKFLGGVPCLEKVTGQIYFTKYMSIGYELGKVPLTYDHLKLIQLYQVSFEDMKEILVVLRLILSSPNLQELQILSSSNAIAASEATNINFWETDYPIGCTLKNRKTVKISDLSGVPREMEFLNFLLKNFPVLG